MHLIWVKFDTKGSSLGCLWCVYARPRVRTLFIIVGRDRLRKIGNSIL